MTTIDEPLLDDLLPTKVLPEKVCKEVRQKVCELINFVDENRRELIENGSEEKFWEEFQKQFGFSEPPKKPKEEQYPYPIPMNAANLCPEPELLLEAANILRLNYNKNVAQQTRMCKTRECKEGEKGIRVRQLEAVRKLLAEGIGLSRHKREEWESVAMVRNSSEANNAICAGIRDWKKGDNVVVWEENHPTNLAD